MGAGFKIRKTQYPKEPTRTRKPMPSFNYSLELTQQQKNTQNLSMYDFKRKTENRYIKLFSNRQ